MIPGVMVKFLGRASIAVASTRDARKVPRIHFLSGWSVDEDGRSVTCLVPEAFSDNLATSLAAQPQIAMVAEVIGPHECYQFKGRYRDSRPVNESDRAIHRACRERFVEAVERHLPGRFSDATLRSRMREPVIAVRFAVREIFVQTPGPAAGRRLFPAEG